MEMKYYQKGLIGIAVCIFFFALGYIILNYISTMENPPLGITFNILIGSTLCLLSILGFVLIIKYLYKTKNKYKKRLHRKVRKLERSQNYRNNNT